VDNKKPEFVAKFASGQIPAFEDKDGFTLFEGAVIASYGEFQSTNQTDGPHLQSYQWRILFCSHPY
jgi:hypothetical protein